MTFNIGRILAPQPDPVPTVPGKTLSRRIPSGETANILFAEMLSAQQAQAQTMTDIAARLEGRMTNNVLLVETFQVSTEGYKTFDFSVAAGAVNVSNPGANIVTVDAMGPRPGGTAPVTGVGVYRIPGGAGGHRTVPVASRSVTIYGTGGDYVSVVFYASVPTPVSA